MARLIALPLWATLPLAASAVIVSTLAWSQSPRSDPGLYVEKLTFTNAVDNAHNFEYEFGTTARASTILVWTRLRGTQSDIEAMRRNGQLPIKHKWFVSCGAAYHFDPHPVMVDEISLDVGRERLLGKLQVEVDQRTWFDWRTWSRKKNVKSCHYQVKVVDNRNKPLFCKDREGDCIANIELKNEHE